MIRVLCIDPAGTCNGDDYLNQFRAADQRPVCGLPLDEVRKLYQAACGQETRPGR